jgi:sarcosine oxidase delta subunit
MAVHRYLVTAQAGPKMDMWADTGAFANWITGRDNPSGNETETWLVTVYAENSEAFLTAARDARVTVEEIQGSDDTEQYLLRVGEPGTGWAVGVRDQEA